MALSVPYFLREIKKQDLTPALSLYFRKQCFIFLVCSMHPGAGVTFTLPEPGLGRSGTVGCSRLVWASGREAETQVRSGPGISNKRATSPFKANVRGACRTATGHSQAPRSVPVSLAHVCGATLPFPGCPDPGDSREICRSATVSLSENCFPEDASAVQVAGAPGRVRGEMLSEMITPCKVRSPRGRGTPRHGSEHLF